jgi:riboflavin synthase
MFTGLIQALGRVVANTEGKLRVAVDGALGAVAAGDSIAVAGVCLTALDDDSSVLSFAVSPETLARTTLGRLPIGARVNLEPSLLPTSRMGGHWVSGHVDAVGTVLERAADGAFERWRFSLPLAIAPLVAVKGSIAIDGTSLTVNAVDSDSFAVTLIPHTLTHTTFAERGAGDSVNLEADLLARYAARVLEFAGAPR